jgi:hypothetical protein
MANIRIITSYKQQEVNKHRLNKLAQLLLSRPKTKENQDEDRKTATTTTTDR